MAINFSGGIDVTDSFVKGFSAIAQVNLRKQALNLEAAQMVQNYNLKQQEMDQDAQFLPTRYQTAQTAQAAALLRAQSEHLHQERLLTESNKIEADTVGFYNATKGVDLTKPDGLNRLGKAWLEFPRSKQSPRVIGMVNTWTKLYPEQAAGLNDLFQRPTGLPGNLQPTGATFRTKSGSVRYGVPPEPPAEKAKRQLRDSERIVDLNSKMKAYEGLNVSYLHDPIETDREQNMVLHAKNPDGTPKTIKVPLSTWTSFRKEYDEIQGQNQAAAQPATTGAVDIKAVAQKALDDPNASEQYKAAARRILGL